MSKQNRETNRAARAAAIQAADARKERNRRMVVVTAIVVALGAVVAAGAWLSGGSSDLPDSSSVEVAAVDGALRVGSTDAPVSVVIYEDFLCPYCRELEESTRDFLRENAAEGKVQVEYRPINLLTDFAYSERSLNAWAAVLEHSTPQAALKLHDLFFLNENQPYEQSSDDVSDADIAKLVAEAGGDNDAVKEAMKSKNTAFFTAAAQDMADKGITGTPTVFIDGQQVTGASIGQLRDAIEKAVAAAPGG